MPSLGYVHDHPEAIASQTGAHWDLEMVMAGVPPKAVPASYRVPNLRPAALDQDGIGACVAFAASLIRDTQEADPNEWGKHLYASGTVTPPTGCFLGYDWLKHGHGTYPGDGLPGVEGSYPEQVWKLAKAEGIPDAKGVPHKIAAYYSHSLANDADVAFLQQVLMTLGPVNIATPWPSAWMAAPKGPAYLMPPPTGGMAGGHSYTIIGWTTTLDGTVLLTCMNSWGYWGSAQGVFQFPVKWCFGSPLGPQIIWKTLDLEDAPPMPLTLVDKIVRLVDSHIGAQIWKTDGITPFTKIVSGALNISSPGKLSNDFYAVMISTGGTLALGAIRGMDVTNIRPQVTDPAAIETARKAGQAAGARAVKDAAIAEAILQGGHP